MANPGVGTKFVSVNLNKSYGQQPSHHHHPHQSSSYGSNRTRPGGHGSGGGGGMVVLSRPRSSQKVGPKLSVPPPLNLPSLRKEHERFDSLGSGGGPAGGGVSGSGSRPTSSGMGWTKPGGGAIALQEKEGSGNHGAEGLEQGLHGSSDGVIKGSSVYMPPSARPSTVGPLASTIVHTPVEKAPVLRGEDFPSLHATLPSSSGPAQKQKDGLSQKQKHVVGDESFNEHRDGSQLSSLVDMRPQSQSSHQNFSNGSENVVEPNGLGGSRATGQGRKQEEYFPGPLPLVRLNPRSDWADDERDTSHGLMDRGRDHAFPKNEAYWDRDFDMPRISVLPQKPVHNPSERWGQRDDETGKVSSSEVPKVDPYAKEVRTLGREAREGNSWKNSNVTKDGFSTQEVGNDRNGFSARTSSLYREASKENKYNLSVFRENGHADFGRRDVGYGQGVRQPWHNMDSHGGRGADRNTRERYGGDQHSSRYRSDASHNSFTSKSSYSSSGKGPVPNDSLLNFGREKRPFSKSEKPYIEDPFMKEFGATGFDGRDPFSGGLIGVVKRKKDVLKQTDFHDPVRESFEAELERVQKLQEQERQRIIEEQERASEMARREEEERARLAREQEERQRKMEEEAREAAYKAEQERLDAIQRAEEQRITREKEKQRMVMEEERRKQAAKQKLLELEERIAKRQAEATKTDSSSSAIEDDKMYLMVKEKDVTRAAEIGDWEDGERMVERITTSASSDSSSMNRPLEMGSRHHFSRDGSSAYLDRGRPANSWRRDAYENGNSSTLHLQGQDNVHHSPRRDASIGGRAYSRKEPYGGSGLMASRSYHKGGISEPHMDDFSHLKGQRWNLSGDGDQYSRNTEIDPEFHDNLDVGWGPGHSRGTPYSLYPERLYPNSEGDGAYSFGRSRYSMRQPRVLPPPTLASMHKTSYRGEIEHTGPSAFLENEMQYNHGARSEPLMQTAYDSSHRENLGQPEIIVVQQVNAEKGEQELDGNTSLRCDSQSSLSVSSPPTSPTHLSHDDLEESRESSVLSAGGDNKDVPLPGQGNEPVILATHAGKDNRPASSSASIGDDEEWAIENNEELQEQEEYDEDEDGYQEEDEAHEGDDENIDLVQEFEDMHLEEKVSSDMMENLVLGFNEGVEVGMPNDEFESSSRNEKSAYAIPPVSSRTVEEQRSFDGIHGEGHIRQPPDGTQLSIDSSSRMLLETERVMQDLVVQQSNAPQTAVVTKLLDQVDNLSSSSLSSQHPVNMGPHSSSGQTVLSTVPTVPNQAEVPVKLQFGLFSGPSLIPSPVPAIQIGSIQMPLHLHPQVGHSLTHVHPTQPPLFQFGQLRYTSPISQGVLPLGAQSMSFVQPNIPSSFSFNQNPGSSMHIQPGQDSSQNLVKSDVSVDNQANSVSRHLDASHMNASKEVNSLPSIDNGESAIRVQRCQSEISCIGDNNSRSESGIHSEDQGRPNLVVKNYSALPITQESEGQAQTRSALSQPVIKERDLSGPKAQGTLSGGRGKRFVFAVKNSGSRSSIPASESTHLESGGYQRRPRRNAQRTEFRVRESADKRQSSGLVSTDHLGMEENSNIIGQGIGISGRSGPRKVIVMNKASKQTSETENLSSGLLSSRENDSGTRAEKGAGKEALTKSWNIPLSGEGKLKRNTCSEEDVDAPLQSGIVRVFEQPGIEAPSDEDDFIEVRSKRQMLNDRREQREKEIKAKSRASKVPRKTRSTSKNTISSANSGKVSASTGGEAVSSIRPDFVANEGRGLANIELSTGFNTSMVPQPLAPIGTPPVKSDAQADIRFQTMRSIQTSSHPVTSSAVKNLGPGLIFDNKNKVLDNVQSSIGSWGNSRINQQVMALTQTQLDEAMKPGQFDSRASVGNHTSSISESSMTSSSILTKDKFSSAASPINSLLAGEKIQFGAVTSPTILPPSSHAVSHGIGPPGPCRPDVQISHNLSGAENECGLLFEKEKHNTKSCVHLEDCEAEAEAAASAVAVAAISSDEIVGNALGPCSVSVSETKSFRGTDIDITAGGAVEQQFTSQSRAEESLNVSLPADLSVETPPISLWPPLPSPENSSSQMLSHFHGGPPSHFPFYEMNPMLGGPVFAFGPHDESASNTQSQTQKSAAPASAPLGTWQQCHSGVDSFYGPPAGFTGPFISAPGGIPGVQGPPHMVVYNHFAPVGQFGQVGLSFMGTTYIPSGKQPDWKHNSVSSAMGVGDGEINNLNMVSTQRNPTNLPTPIQHLAPGSPLLPMASPLAMFDVSPFQSSPDMPVQARWPHVPASPLQSVPLSMPLQQQADGALPSKFGHVSVDQSLAANRFPESQTCTTSDKNRNYPVATDATVTQLPDELGLVDPSSSTGTGVSAQSVVARSSAVNVNADTNKTEMAQNGSSNGSGQSNIKTQTSQHKIMSGQQYGHSSGYNYQRGGGASQKNSSGGEWNHRRSGFQGRNQSLGAEKSFHSSKMKQIYVAKQTSSGTSTGPAKGQGL